MSDYNEKTVDELKDEAKSRDLSGYSDKNKKDLVALLEEDDAKGQSEAEPLGAQSEASDADNPEVVENLSPEGQQALGELSPEAVEQADLALDASGPLKLQPPSERLAVGAVNEEQAKEQEELFKDLPDDHVGNLREDGFTGEGERQGSGPNGEVVQEDVIDFPPPLEKVEEENAAKTDGAKARVESVPSTKQEAANAAFPDEGPYVAQPRLFNQRAQVYTDGLSGVADHNTELSYRVNDVTAGNFHVQAVKEAQADSPKNPEDEPTAAERAAADENKSDNE